MSTNEVTIVVVEDEEHLAQGLRFNLEADGYRVLVYGDGESAIEALLQPENPIAAVVLDVMLPGRDGFSVVQELRDRQNYTRYCCSQHAVALKMFSPALLPAPMITCPNPSTSRFSLPASTASCGGHPGSATRSNR